MSSNQITEFAKELGRVIEIQRTGEIEARCLSWNSKRDAPLVWRFRTNTRDRSFIVENEFGIYFFFDPNHGYGYGDRVDFSTADPLVKWSRAPKIFRLCFPVDLDIWGGRDDRWKFVDFDPAATSETTEFYLVSTSESELRRTLVYNHIDRLLTRQLTFKGNEIVAERRIYDIDRPRRRPLVHHEDGEYLVAGQTGVEPG